MYGWGGNVFVSGDELLANDSNDYYVMVYINNLDEPQYDSGEFNGTVTFTSEDGKQVKGRFTKPFNLVQKIQTLYNDAQKSTVTNNEIDYQYATSANLMKDKLGGTSDTLDSGNLRYYGLEPNNYIDIGDTLQEGMVTKGNWESVFGSNAPFTTSQECMDFFDCSKIWQSQGLESEEACNAALQTQLSQAGFESFEQMCKVETKYVREPILWRIIGVFDGKLRIVRDESIGSYPYDTSIHNSGFNGGHGINQWGPSKYFSNGNDYTGADLMKLLNPGYENNQDNIVYDIVNETDYVNNSLWWNKQSGTCYTGQNNGASECDFTTTGLSNDIKDYVVDQTLYLGGFSNNDISSYANQAYTVERGNDVSQPDDNSISYRDMVIRTTKWTGKVGLIYPSDMGYAADFSSCNSTFDYLCPSWLNNNNNRVLRTISPKSDNATFVLNFSKNFIVDNNAGETYDSSSDGEIGVYPTLLLDSSVLAESGNGSLEHPYVVAY